MVSKIRKLINEHTLVRYVLVGGISYVIELSVLLALYKLVGLSAELSTAIAFWVGLATSFILQKLVAFRDYAKTAKLLSKQLLSYAALVLGNYIFTLCVVALFPSKWIILSRTLALAITTAWNFIFYKKIFNNQLDSKSDVVSINRRIVLRQLALILLLTIPIILFDLDLLLTGNKVIPGDQDYSVALTEAFRKTVLHYHQFPFWNPWLDGGIPLFGNVQFGLISIESPFILLFGAPFGWKLAIVMYHLVAFFGFRKLFMGYFKTPALKANLLAYIGTFSSIFTYRIVAGHYTFLLLAFAPWLIYFFLNRERPKSWVWFALVFSFMIWSAPHYATIMSAAVVGIWYFYSLLAVAIRRGWDLLKQLILNDLRFWIKAGLLIIILTAYRMLFVLSFIKDFPRPESSLNEKYTGIIRGLEAIWGPSPYNHPHTLPTGWGWLEASAYIGLGTLAAVLLIFAAIIMNKWPKRDKSKSQESYFSASPILIGVLFLTFFMISMGAFIKYSPFVALSQLPVFNNMRVATRWLAWCSFCVLFFIAAYRGSRYRRLINVALLLAAAELFLIGFSIYGNYYTTTAQQYRPPYAAFNEVYRYRIPRPQYANDKTYQLKYPYDENLYETVLNNYGQVIAGDSLVDTRQPGKTIRCGFNVGDCKFISPNAKISYWSPDRIVIKRTAPGWIQLNMNPGRGWKVNGKYAFLGYKVTDPLQPFLITDHSQTIVLQYTPKYSVEWLSAKL